MIATYRVQLRPGFGFAELRGLLPYFRRLGISHLYLSPITEARAGSTHGYDVVDHNRIRDELGGQEDFFSLLKAARATGLALILDFVPNHAGVGSRNARWQDVLAYGPHSPYAARFDIDWDPFKPELHHKVLLPYLDSPYGEALDRGEIVLVYEEQRIAAAYRGNRFSLSPPTYADVLAEVLPTLEHNDLRDILRELEASFRALLPHERGTADALRRRLSGVAEPMGLAGLLATIRAGRLHDILERQFWRLSYWKTAASEINYRRFFDINDLVALRSEDPEVFSDTHRLLARLSGQPGIEGVRVDHIDGLFDPLEYLVRLRDLRIERVWVEKILAPGEILPPHWPVEGTSGYEFLNDVLSMLTWSKGELPLDRICRRFVRDARTFGDEVHRSKRLVMETALSGELFRLTTGLDRISEGDYHTRDFTFEALRDALAEIIAAIPRYRIYLPHDRQEAERVIQEAIHQAQRRNPGAEPTVFAFIGQVLMGHVDPALRQPVNAWTGRFQQYTAVVAAKGVEDTAFYRFCRFVALNEVGGDPDRFGITPEAFHAHARFRAMRYPQNMLATATHDHKRGEDLRMRLIVLAELPEMWQQTLSGLTRQARRYRSRAGPSRRDEFIFYQTLVALWDGADRDALTARLAQYMRKVAREAKLRTSWLNPDSEYEKSLDDFVGGILSDPGTPPVIEPLALVLMRYGFINSLSQLVLKLTAPGVPDFYQGCELLDLSLVDPDNRQPVDFERRTRALENLEPLLASPDPQPFRRWIAACDQQAKLYVAARLLRFRQLHPALFSAGYRALEPRGTRADHLVAYARETNGEALMVVVPRFPAALDRAGGWADTSVLLPPPLSEREWINVLTAHILPMSNGFHPDPDLPWAVLFSEDESLATSGPGEA